METREIVERYLAAKPERGDVHGDIVNRAGLDWGEADEAVKEASGGLTWNNTDTEEDEQELVQKLRDYLAKEQLLDKHLGSTEETCSQAEFANDIRSFAAKYNISVAQVVLMLADGVLEL